MVVQNTEKIKIIKKMSYEELEIYFGTEPFLLSCGWIDKKFQNITFTTCINNLKDETEKLIIEKTIIPDYIQSIFPYYITMILESTYNAEQLCEKYLNNQITEEEKKYLYFNMIIFYCSRNLEKSISEFPVVIEEYI